MLFIAIGAQNSDKRLTSGIFRDDYETNIYMCVCSLCVNNTSNGLTLSNANIDKITLPTSYLFNAKR